jgi:hypothetical protein
MRQERRHGLSPQFWLNGDNDLARSFQNGLLFGLGQVLIHHIPDQSPRSESKYRYKNRIMVVVANILPRCSIHA